jgi:hypothetical protein
MRPVHHSPAADAGARPISKEGVSYPGRRGRTGRRGLGDVMSARPGLYGGQPVMVVPTVIANNPASESLCGEPSRASWRLGVFVRLLLPHLQ